VRAEEVSDVRPIAIMIVSDVRLYREGLATSLCSRSNLRVVPIKDDASATLDHICDVAPDIVLIDTSTRNSVEIVRALRLQTPSTKAIAFAVHEHEQEIITYAEAGAAGYVTCDASFDQLIAAIEGVAREELVCSPRIASTLFRRLGTHGESDLQSRDGALTHRERQVLSLIRDGLSNKEIAHTLNVAESTVKNHVHNLLEKLRVANRTQAAGRTPSLQARCVRLPAAAARTRSNG
jgi:two-component system nitrate/nitrite response regulator NarL